MRLPGGSSSQQPFLRVREPGLYAASFTARGCLYQDTVLVGGGVAASLPNVLTLNGDGVNRFLTTTCLPTGRLELYNRWGSRVYAQDPYDQHWPPADAAPGTYFYRFAGRDGTRQQGWVEVVR